MRTHSGKVSAWIVPALILVAGLFCYLWQYTHRQSFWKDETGLARNFLVRTLANIHEPFPDAQAAPIGFVQLSKVAEMALGHSEHTFWLLPLIIGVLGLILAVTVWRGLLPHAAWLWALGLWALNPTLIMHITQFKPYLTDAVVALALTGAFFYYRSGKSFGAWLYLAVGLWALWMSYTSVFVLTGFGLWMVIESFLTVTKARFWRVFFVNFILGSIFLLLYIFNYAHIDPVGAFDKFWAPNFAPLPGMINFPSWYINDFPTVIGYLFGQGQWLIWAFFTLVGVAWSARNDKKLLVLLTPIAVNFIVSWLHIYPIYDRLQVFWLPLLVPFVALGIYTLWEALRDKTRGLTTVLALCVVLPFLYPLSSLPGTRDPQELKQTAMVVSSRAKAGDVVYIHARANEFYKYYFKRFPLASGVDVVYGDQNEAFDLYTVLKNKYASRHVWVLFTEPFYMPNEMATLAQAAQEEIIGIADFNLAGALELRLK